MKKIGIVLLLIIITIIAFFHTKNDTNYISAEDDLISKQARQDENILKYTTEGYTIDNPKIIINPYYISPLTALIIFNTEETINIQLLINDEEYQSIENEKNFIIPIVYLKEDYNNKITIVVDNQDEYIYYIKTEKIINTKISLKTSENKKYLVSSPNSDVKHSLLDSKGNLIWYLDLDSSDFLEEYDDFSFIIGVEETKEESNILTPSGIYIIDYLGKILKRIDTKYNYHHEVICNGNNAYLLGTKGDVPLNLIYEIDLDNGNIIDEVDIYELLVKYSPDIKHYLDSLSYGLFINSIDIKDNNLLISIRNLNTIMEIDMTNKSINWIITNSKEMQSCFKEYLKKINIKLLGNHHAKYIDSNTISFYNNGYDYSNENSNTFASGIIIDITKNEIVANYDIPKYSYAYGSIEVKDTTLINYSYLLKDISIEPQNIDNTYSQIIEYNKKNKVITDIKIDAPIYRAKIFAINLLEKYFVKNYIYLNNYDEVTVSKINNYQSINNILKITNNSIETTISDDTYKEMIIVFKGKKQYNIKYLKSKLYFDIEDGIYDVFISMDNKWYKLETKVKIGEKT